MWAGSPPWRLDGAGKAHISYCDWIYSTFYDLKYARWDGSAWFIQTVDSAEDVGRYASLALDGAGNPHIGYYDSIHADLKYAQWNGSAWLVQVVDSTGRWGSMAPWHWTASAFRTLAIATKLAMMCMTSSTLVGTAAPGSLRP